MRPPSSGIRTPPRDPESEGEPLFADVPDPLDFSSASAAAHGAAAPSIPAPTHTSLRRRRGLAVGLVAAWFAAQVALLGVRRDLRDLPGEWWLAFVAMPLLLAVACYVAAMAAGRMGVGLRRSALISVLLLATLWLLSAGALFTEPASHASMARDAKCFGLATLWSSLPIGAGAVLLERSFLTSSWLRTALIGSACGLLAGATAGLHCATNAARHVVLGHALPVLVLSLVCALALAKRTRI